MLAIASEPRPGHTSRWADARLVDTVLAIATRWGRCAPSGRRPGHSFSQAGARALDAVVTIAVVGQVRAQQELASTSRGNTTMYL